MADMLSLGDLPSPLYVKNTFLDVLEADPAEPTYKSCPAAVFAGGSLADLARAFTGGAVTREALEAAGHLKPPTGKAETEDAWEGSTADPSSSTEDEGSSAEEESDVGVVVGPDAPPSWSPRLPEVPCQALPAGAVLATRPAAPSAPVSSYRVAFVGGIAVRQGPSYRAPQTGVTLCCGETFAVSEELPSSDGCVYLRLGDGRGWVFDDSALMPHDPSVVRGRWELAPAAAAPVAWEAEEVPPSGSADAADSPHKRRHRKRGGARRMKGVRRRRALEEAAAKESDDGSPEESDEE